MVGQFCFDKDADKCWKTTWNFGYLPEGNSEKTKPVTKIGMVLRSLLDSSIVEYFHGPKTHIMIQVYW